MAWLSTSHSSDARNLCFSRLRTWDLYDSVEVTAFVEALLVEVTYLIKNCVLDQFVCKLI